MAFSRFVALGDSFTEGIGDPDPDSPNGVRGWADLLAARLAADNADFRYANLAVRGRIMADIMTDQVTAAALMEPDLVSIYAGMNDLMALSLDVDAMMAVYAEGLKSLQQTGAVVLTFTAPDLGAKPLFRGLRGRAAIYNELLRAITDDFGIGLIDFWRFDEFRDSRLWNHDRVHLSPLGHEVMAARVFDALPISNGRAVPSAGYLATPARPATVTENLRWAAAFAAPWAFRRLRRMTPGAGVAPKSSTLTKVIRPDGPAHG